MLIFFPHINSSCLCSCRGNLLTLRSPLQSWLSNDNTNGKIDPDLSDFLCLCNWFSILLNAIVWVCGGCLSWVFWLLATASFYYCFFGLALRDQRNNIALFFFQGAALPTPPAHTEAFSIQSKKSFQHVWEWGILQESRRCPEGSHVRCMNHVTCLISTLNSCDFNPEWLNSLPNV